MVSMVVLSDSFVTVLKRKHLNPDPVWHCIWKLILIEKSILFGRKYILYGWLLNEIRRKILKLDRDLKSNLDKVMKY